MRKQKSKIGTKRRSKYKNSSPSLVCSTRTCFDLSSGALDRLVTVRFVQCQCCSRHARRSRLRIRWLRCWWIHDCEKNVPIDRQSADFLHPPRPFQNVDCDRSINAYREGFSIRRQAAAKWYVALKVTIVRHVVRDYCQSLTKRRRFKSFESGIYHAGIAISVHIRAAVSRSLVENTLYVYEQTHAFIQRLILHWEFSLTNYIVLHDRA